MEVNGILGSQVPHEIVVQDSEKNRENERRREFSKI